MFVDLPYWTYAPPVTQHASERGGHTIDTLVLRAHAAGSPRDRVSHDLEPRSYN